MRLIDADELYKLPCVHGAEGTWICLEDIRNIPTADAVPVVRCKDCKWYERKYPWNAASTECSYLEAPMDDNDYCSWGERREDETG